MAEIAYYLKELKESGIKQERTTSMVNVCQALKLLM
jgi:hypothetical protein